MAKSSDKPKIILKQDREGTWREGNGQFVKPPVKPTPKKG